MLTASDYYISDFEADQDEASIMDEGKAAQHEATVNSVEGQANEFGLGLPPSPGDEKVALGLFPKVRPFSFLIHLLLTGTQVAGFARQVHDSPTLQKKIEKLVDAQTDFDPGEAGEERTLTRPVVTRWSSNLACLAALIALETPAKGLTSDSSSKLEQFALTEEEWKLAKS